MNNIPSIQDFNGEGRPLDDKRLTLSGTTAAGKQQYRIWRDSETILVPKGQSITKPLQPENVQANVGVHGSINKGYFSAPTVEWRNTNNYKLFDRMTLAAYKDGSEIGEDDNLDDMGVIQLNAGFTLMIDWYNNHWEFDKQIWLTRGTDNVLDTDVSSFSTTYTPWFAQGQSEWNIELSGFYTIDRFETHDLGAIGVGTHHLMLGLQKAVINRGSSEYLYNPYFNPNIPPIDLSIKNFVIERAWI